MLWSIQQSAPHGLQGLLNLLVVLLDRGSPQLLLLATTFLHRLSLSADNCCPICEAEVVGQLVGMLPSASRLLLSSVLRLLHNLAFDGGMRQQMVAAGLITKAVDLLKGDAEHRRDTAGGGSGTSVRPGAATPRRSRQEGPTLEGTPVQQLALGILYRLAQQDRHRSMFLYTGKLSSQGCLAPLTCRNFRCNTGPPLRKRWQPVLASLDPFCRTRPADAPATLHAMLMAAELPLAASSLELAALLVSLAGSQRVAEEMARGGRLEQLLELAVGPAEPRQPSDAPDAAAGGAGSGDELLWKLLRTMAAHDSEPLRARFGPALPRLARLLMVGLCPGSAPAVRHCTCWRVGLHMQWQCLGIDTW